MQQCAREISSRTNSDFNASIFQPFVRLATEYLQEQLQTLQSQFVGDQDLLASVVSNNLTRSRFREWLISRHNEDILDFYSAVLFYKGQIRPPDRAHYANEIWNQFSNKKLLDLDFADDQFETSLAKGILSLLFNLLIWNTATSQSENLLNSSVILLGRSFII